jgi:hypothetical protein
MGDKVDGKDDKKPGTVIDWIPGDAGEWAEDTSSLFPSKLTIKLANGKDFVLGDPNNIFNKKK